MFEMTVILMLLQIAALTTVSVLFYMRGQEIKSLKFQVDSARKDSLHWYNRVHELEMTNHTTNTDPCFTGTGHTPKDYEE